jgi:hypothetical protein
MLAALPNHLIEPALIRAVGVPLVCWTNLTTKQLRRIIGATVAVRLINDVDS